LANCKPINSLVYPNQKLLMVQGETFQNLEIQKVGEKLLYLTITRLNISLLKDLIQESSVIGDKFSL